MQRHTIYIPCFNCEPQIKRVITALEKLSLEPFLSIVFIDNASTDETALAITQSVAKTDALKAKCLLIKHQLNYGLGGSFKTAVEHAKKTNTSYMYFLHGDDQAAATDLIKMYRLASEGNVSAIFGARFMPESKLINYSKVREIGNRILNKIFSYSLKKIIYDLGSGLNAYRVETLPHNQISKWPSHIAFDIHLLFHYSNKKYATIQMPILWRESDQVSNAHNIKTGLLLIKELVYYLVGLKPNCHNFNRETQTIDYFDANGR